MKSHVNQHSYHLGAIALLVSVSILLLVFGIYKTIVYQNNTKVFYSENVSEAEASINPVIGEILNTHFFEEEQIEQPLEFEAWMTDYSNWGVETTNNFTATNEVSEFYENPLAVEEWMLDLSGWINNEEVFNNDINVDVEPELGIEPWMLDDSSWLEMSNTEVEEELPLESWMWNLNNWGTPVISAEKLNGLTLIEDESSLALESWMMNYSTWLPEKYNEIKIYEFSKTIQEEELKLEAWMLDVDSRFIDDNYELLKSFIA